ncbi:MAG TPA: hypothetical protein VIG06_23475 [Kofleriaceae bacterium]
MRAQVAIALVAACGCGGRGRADAGARPARPRPPAALLAASLHCAPSLCLDGDWFELRFDNLTAAPVWLEEQSEEDAPSRWSALEVSGTSEDGDGFGSAVAGSTCASPHSPACWSGDPIAIAPGAARAWAAPIHGVAVGQRRLSFEVVARWRESPSADAVDAREAERAWRLAVVPTGPPRAGCVPVRCSARR